MTPRFLRPALPLSIVLVACSEVRPPETFDDVTGGAGPGAEGGAASTTSGDDIGDDAPASADTTAASTGQDGIVFDLGTMPDAPQVCDSHVTRSCDQDDDDPFHAIGVGCPGSPDDTIPIHDEIFVSEDARAWTVARAYGTATDPAAGSPVWSPREGEKMLVISTGLLAELDGDGTLTLPAGFAQHGTSGMGGNSNFNGDAKPLPAPMRAQDGSNGGAGGTPFVDCDAVHDCSGSLAHQWDLGGGEANDLLWFSFSAEVPAGITGFSIAFDYFSAEFPEYVGTPYNDMFVLWARGEAYTGNLCFVGSDPCTVTSLWPALYQENAPELAGTGLEGVGGATGWYVARGPVNPGEDLTLTFALFDMHDTILDTTVLLDEFRWECEGCDPSARDCGVEPQG